MTKIGKCALFAALAAVFLSPSGASATITEVTVRVDGLSCPFCAYSLEKQLKEVEGTGTPMIDVKEGLATLAPVGDRPVDFRGLREAVRKAGFTPREIRAIGAGKVETDGGPRLVDEEGNVMFTLESGQTLSGLPRGDKAFPFSGIVLPREKDEDLSRPYTLSLITEEKQP